MYVSEKSGILVKSKIIENIKKRFLPKVKIVIIQFVVVKHQVFFNCHNFNEKITLKNLQRKT